MPVTAERPREARSGQSECDGDKPAWVQWFVVLQSRQLGTDGDGFQTARKRVHLAARRSTVLNSFKAPIGRMNSPVIFIPFRP